MEDTTHTTVTTGETEHGPFPRPGASVVSRDLHPIVYLGLGVAMLECGRVFMEHGLREIGGITEVRRLITRAERLLTIPRQLREPDSDTAV